MLLGCTTHGAGPPAATGGRDGGAAEQREPRTEEEPTATPSAVAALHRKVQVKVGK